MKKLILTLSLLLCATTSLLNAGQILQGNVQPGQRQQHIPAAGLIQLFDSPAKEGIIKDIITKDAHFQEERIAVNSFIAQHNLINPTYQDILTIIRFTDACLPGAFEVLEAFERAIIYYIQQQNYLITFKDKWLNLFVTGIRKPSCWFSDGPILQQCMNELSILAQITEKYSTVASIRMKATVKSYLHWRKTMLIAMGTYTIANGIFRRDFKKSPIGILANSGLMGSPKIIAQLKDDVVDFTTTIGNFVVPIGNFVLKGWGKSDQSIETKEQIIPSKLIPSTIKIEEETPLSIPIQSSKESSYSRFKKSFLEYNQNIYTKFFEETKAVPETKTALNKSTSLNILSKINDYPDNQDNKRSLYSQKTAQTINKFCSDNQKRYNSMVKK